MTTRQSTDRPAARSAVTGGGAIGVGAAGRGSCRGGSLAATDETGAMTKVLWPLRTRPLLHRSFMIWVRWPRGTMTEQRLSRLRRPVSASIEAS